MGSNWHRHIWNSPENSYACSDACSTIGTIVLKIFLHIVQNNQRRHQHVLAASSSKPDDISMSRIWYEHTREAWYSYHAGMMQTIIWLIYLVLVASFRQQRGKGSDPGQPVLVASFRQQLNSPSPMPGLHPKESHRWDTYILNSQVQKENDRQMSIRTANNQYISRSEPSIMISSPTTFDFRSCFTLLCSGLELRS